MLGTALKAPLSTNQQEACLVAAASGGAETLLATAGVITTAVGYAGGFTPIPVTKRSAQAARGTRWSGGLGCDGFQRPPETVLGMTTSPRAWPRGMTRGPSTALDLRQRTKLLAVAEASRDRYQELLNGSGKGAITTEIALGKAFSSQRGTTSSTWPARAAIAPLNPRASCSINSGRLSLPTPRCGLGELRLSVSHCVLRGDNSPIRL